MPYRIATLPQTYHFTLNTKEVYSFSEKDTLGERIRKLRKINNLTAKDLASKLEITPSGVIGYENNNAYPSKKIILKIYEIFGKDLLCDSYSRFIVQDYISLIENWRIENNLTKRVAAEKLGIGEGFYYTLLNNQYELTHSYFNKIKDKLIIYKLIT